MTIELEHAIGFACAVPGGLRYHPNGRDFVYTAGGCIVVGDFTDPHNQSFLRGHDANISCLAMSASGRFLASGQYGENADVVVWDFAKKKLLYRFSEHDHGIAAIAFSDDERLLVSVGDATDKKMFVWDIATGCINASTTMQPLPTNIVAFGGMVKNIKRRATTNYLISTAGDGKVFLWSLNPFSGELASVQVATSSYKREYTCFLFSEDREWLYAGTTTGDFACISIKSRSLLSFVTVCSGGVLSLTSPGKNRLVASGGDGTVKTFVGEGKEWLDEGSVRVDGMAQNVSASGDAGEVLAGTTNGFIYRVRLGRGGLTSLSVCESHASAAASLEEGLGRARTTASGTKETIASRATMAVGGVVGVAYAAKVSDRFASIGTDNTVRVWDASDYSVPVKCSVKSGGHPSSLAYSLDALLTGWEDGQIRCHSADTGDQLWSVSDGHRGGVTSLKMSNNLRFAITGGVGGEVRVWELRSREMVAHLKEHTMAVSSMVLFDDDVHAVTCSRDKSFLCWDLRREKRISSHTQRMGGINDVELSRDQSLVLSVGQERKITYWDLREPHPVQTISPAHDGEALCISMSPTTDYFVTGGSDSMVKLWDMRMGKCAVDGVGHSGMVRDIKFSPDGRQVVSAGTDGCLFVWNVYS